MACSTPPTYWSMGIQVRVCSGSKAPPGKSGEQNRRKYQDESTNVSIVSVSRAAGPPQVGQVVSTQVRFEPRGGGRGGGRAAPGRVPRSVAPGQLPAAPVGQLAPPLVVRDLHAPVGRAVHDRNRAAPLALAAKQ